MLYLTAQTKILLSTRPVDFRRQIDGLIALCEQQFKQDPRSGYLFVFINRMHTMIRVLCYEEQGYWLATKRLSKGRYTLWPSGSSDLTEYHASELTKILKTFVARASRKV